MKSSDIGPLGISAMALLAEKAMHPYEVYQLLLDREQNHMVKVRPGTLYHAIDRMASEGLVSAEGTERAGNRLKRTRYAITEAGRTALEERVVEFLADPMREYQVFPVALGEAHLLDSARVMMLLTRRLAVLEIEAERVSLSMRQTANRSVAECYFLPPMHDAHQRRAEMEWIASLIARIESGDLYLGDESGTTQCT